MSSDKVGNILGHILGHILGQILVHILGHILGHIRSSFDHLKSCKVILDLI